MKTREEKIEVLKSYVNVNGYIYEHDIEAIADELEQQKCYPTDEEIEKASFKYAKNKIKGLAELVGVRETAFSEDELNDFKISHFDGAKWHREQIK